jgi:medium-chain acyl-[acyl-carrier-protein] hydrolase
MDIIDKITAKTNTDVRLICFHYAGGSSVSFYPWKDKIASNVELLAINLPGRGSNIDKPLLNNIKDVTNVVLGHIKHYIDKPLVFFGHSLGGLISFELAKAMKEEGLKQPMHLILSGCMAPQKLYKRKKISRLSNKEFIEVLKIYNGISHEVMNEPSLTELFLPIIKTDISIIDDYKYRGNDPLDCSITTIGGKDDPTVLLEDIYPWESHTTRKYAHHTLEGDHFFIRSDQERVCDIVNNIVSLYHNA